MTLQFTANLFIVSQEASNIETLLSHKSIKERFFWFSLALYVPEMAQVIVLAGWIDFLVHV